MLVRIAVCLICPAAALFAETGQDAWLRYAAIEDAAVLQRYSTLPASVVVTSDSPVMLSAREELIRGVRGMLGRTLRIEKQAPADGGAIVLSVAGAELKADAFRIVSRGKDIAVSGGNDAGVLYGVFALLRKMALHQPLRGLDEREQPYSPLRWINHWDNLDGTIERGYGGRSIFFENNNVRQDLSRVREYARLLASLGVNACAINNVNANPRVISSEFLPQLARIAEVFRAWGIRTAVSVDFSSPQRIGGLTTFDPVDAGVVNWWKRTIDDVYAAVPDLAGVVVKADSEGRLGPSAYKRTHADAANVIARPLQTHKGILFYRGFVYDHRMDWRNLKNDRARAAYDNFVDLDGKFEENVVIQIKHGPIDFQVREPASPLFGALEKTNQSIELQITQEYFGQARYMVFLAPMWKEALDFDLHAKGAGTPVKALAAGKVFSRPTGGFVGVSNVGMDPNWLGHDMSQANLYAFGRLAWNPDLSAAAILDEWTRLTFSHDPLVVKTIHAMQLASWRDFENYTGNLGSQTLTDISGNHYGPSVESSERNGWGQWHRADEKGMGMDRTVATGTGYIGQYRPPVARMYESLATCPDELLLFMHHVPYTHKLKSGKTVIQHIYDAHYEGERAAAAYVDQWKSLKGRVDEPRYLQVLRRLEYQAGHVQVWRDAITSWFLKTSGIADAKGRVGSYPGRVEAEAMELQGYSAVDVKPFEAASGFKAVSCKADKVCSASFRYQGKAGWHTLNVRYFDQNDGVARYKVFVNDQLMDEWLADDRIPTRRVDSHSSSRRLVKGVPLRPSDVIRVEGLPQGNEPAALDYVEVLAPSGGR